MRVSRGLKWENKMYKLKRSITASPSKLTLWVENTTNEIEQDKNPK